MKNFIYDAFVFIIMAILAIITIMAAIVVSVICLKLLEYTGFWNFIFN